MGEITIAAQEQTSGIEQIHQAIAEIDNVTQQNAALVEEGAAIAQTMQDQAQTLSQAVSIFKLHDLGVATHQLTGVPKLLAGGNARFTRIGS